MQLAEEADAGPAGAVDGKHRFRATQGSSVARVAGRNRGPTKQCADASVADRATNKSAGVARAKIANETAKSSGLLGHNKVNEYSGGNDRK